MCLRLFIFNHRGTENEINAILLSVWSVDINLTTENTEDTVSKSQRIRQNPCGQWIKKAVWRSKYPCYFSKGGQKRYLSSSIIAENMLKQGIFERFFS